VTDVRTLIDPCLLPGLELMPPLDLSEAALPEIRAAMLQMVAMLPEPEGSGIVWREERIAASAQHDIAVRVYTPAAAMARPAILQIHGGGYVMGSAGLSHLSNIDLAASLQAVVVSVDYRLAPETPAPGPVEDCYAALVWLVEQAAALGVDPARIAVRGESAGGGLAAALAILARDRGGPSIVHQNLIYPMLDDRTCVIDRPAHQGAVVWTRDANRFGWSALLGREPGGEGVSPYAAPARVEDVAGLPPAFIAVGALDLFVEEDIEFARRLMAAGIAAELHVYPGAYHAFDILRDATPAIAMWDQANAALTRALYSQPADR